MESRTHFGIEGVSFTSFFLFNFLSPKKLILGNKKMKQNVQLTIKPKGDDSNQSYRYHLGKTISVCLLKQNISALVHEEIDSYHPISEYGYTNVPKKTFEVQKVSEMG